MNKIQWFSFSIIFYISSFEANRISIAKNTMATIMCRTDVTAFVPWKIIGDGFFMLSMILIMLGLAFFLAGLAEKEWR